MGHRIQSLGLVTRHSGLLYAFRLVADSEPPAALGATSGNYAAATLGAHAGEEAMFALARDALWLVSTLDHPVVFLLFLNCRRLDGTIRQYKMYFAIIRDACRGVKRVFGGY